METTLMIAGLMLYNSVMCLLRFPGGLANISKTDYFLVFLIADFITLYISMAVLIVGVLVDPENWKQVEQRARKAMGVATVFFVIAVHQVVLTLVGKNNFWLRFFVNVPFIVFMVLTFGAIFILRFGYGKK